MKKNASTYEGRLDGLILFRFGLILKQGGGIEEHLNSVDRLLLERNDMIIIRAFINELHENASINIDCFGRGRLLWVPVEPIEPSSSMKPTNISPFLRLLFPSLAHNLNSLFSRILYASMKKSGFRKKAWLYNQCQGLISQLRLLHEKYRIQLVVLHTLFGVDEAEIINESIKLGIPFSVIYHFESKRLTHPVERMMIKRSVAIGVVSNIGIPEKLRNRVYTIIEGVDGDYFQLEKSSNVGFRKENKLIFMPGRIHPLKGQADAVRALEIISQKNIKVVLALAGRVSSEAAYSELNNVINRIKSSKQVLLLGELDKEKLRDWYAASDLVILPSYSEAVGRTLIEAQLMKRPVIAYNTGGVSGAMIDGITGFLVEKGNINELALRIEQLLNDESLRNKMGEAGRDFAIKNYSLQEMVESHEELYLQAITNQELKTKKPDTKTRFTKAG